ncbi:hypothetical protein IAU59_006736 [Kwoniella sp. CBS 9459]
MQPYHLMALVASLPVFLAWPLPTTPEGQTDLDASLKSGTDSSDFAIAAIGRGIAAIGAVPEPTTTTTHEDGVEGLGIAAIGRRGIAAIGLVPEPAATTPTDLGGLGIAAIGRRGIAAIGAVIEPTNTATVTGSDSGEEGGAGGIGIAAIGRGIAAIGLLPEPTTTSTTTIVDPVQSATEQDVHVDGIGRRAASASVAIGTQPTNSFPTQAGIAAIGRRENEGGSIEKRIVADEEEEEKIFVLGLGIPLFDEQ